MNAFSFETPAGGFFAVQDGDCIVRTGFGEPPDGVALQISPLLARFGEELGRYFSGRLRDFSVPFRPCGTAFRLAVWSELVRIPYGSTRSYGEVAFLIQNPRACRAVGSACNKNPLPLLIPCHRAVAAGGALGGFAYGTELKLRLLSLEAGGKF